MLIVTKLGKVVTYNEAHRHQTRKGADLPWVTPTLNVTRSFYHETKRGHVRIWKIYISNFTRLMTTKLDRVLTSRKSFSMQSLKLSPTSRCFFYHGSSRSIIWATIKEYCPSCTNEFPNLNCFHRSQQLDRSTWHNCFDYIT